MNMERQRLEIQRDALYRYYCTIISLLGLLVLGVGVIVTFLAVWLFAHRWIRQWVDGMRYEIGDDVLWTRIPGWFSVEQSVPLARITDMTLWQGPIQRFFGIHSLRIQTAGGRGSVYSGAVLIGLASPEAVRQDLLARIGR